MRLTNGQKWLLILALMSFVVASNIWFYTVFIPHMAHCR